LRIPRESHPLRIVQAMPASSEVIIECANGVNATLLELQQEGTYFGLWDGAPTHEINEQLLDQVSRGASGRIPRYLVRPSEVPLTHVRQVAHRSLPAALPIRRCHGVFQVGSAVLEIVWFQNEWAPPISPVVMADLRELDFLALAQPDPWDPDEVMPQPPMSQAMIDLVEVTREMLEQRQNDERSSGD